MFSILSTARVALVTGGSSDTSATCKHKLADAVATAVTEDGQ